MEAATARLKRRSAKQRGGYGRSERRLAGAMLAPSLIVIAAVAAYPIGYAFWLSLTEYSLRVPGKWRFVGFDNYSEALSSPEFWDALTTTFVFSGISVALELVIGLGMALCMHEAFKGRALLRTVVLVPWAVLTVDDRHHLADDLRAGPRARAGAARQARDCPARTSSGSGEEPYALGVMIFADVWKTAPFMALLILAGLQVIPDELYDAAKVDGASTWQRFRSITLPLLKPAILIALIFRTLDALRIFDLPYVLTQGANGTTTLSLIAQQELTTNRLIGLGSALSVLTFVIVMAVAFIYIRAVGGNIRALAEET